METYQGGLESVNQGGWWSGTEARLELSPKDDRSKVEGLVLSKVEGAGCAHERDAAMYVWQRTYRS
jgi:hypothetical protein